MLGDVKDGDWIKIIRLLWVTIRSNFRFLLCTGDALEFLACVYSHRSSLGTM